MNIEANNTYVIYNAVGLTKNPFKALILEATEKTLFIQNLDSEEKKKFRITKDDFENKYVVLEKVDDAIQTFVEKHTPSA